MNETDMPFEPDHDWAVFQTPTGQELRVRRDLVVAFRADADGDTTTIWFQSGPADGVMVAGQLGKLFLQMGTRRMI